MSALKNEKHCFEFLTVLLKNESRNLVIVSCFVFTLGVYFHCRERNV
uniref:Uncharacterized protein n=2 Tax=Anguilla anguilla TaxID=7936 RepID=A0A0E9R093_ANGAN